MFIGGGARGAGQGAVAAGAAQRVESQAPAAGGRAAVSAFIAWIRSPCLRHCVHGASIGSGARARSRSVRPTRRRPASSKPRPVSAYATRTIQIQMAVARNMGWAGLGGVARLTPAGGWCWVVVADHTNAMQNALLSRPERSRSTDKQRLLGAVRLESTALAGEAELTKVRGEFERYLAARYQVTLHRMQTFQRSGWLRRWADASSLSARRRQLLRRAVARLIHSTLWRFVEQWRDAATQRSYYRRRQTPQLLALLRTQVRRVPTPACLPACTHARTHARKHACVPPVLDRCPHAGTAAAAPCGRAVGTLRQDCECGLVAPLQPVLAGLAPAAQRLVGQRLVGQRLLGPLSSTRSPRRCGGRRRRRHGWRRWPPEPAPTSSSAICASRWRRSSAPAKTAPRHWSTFARPHAPWQRRMRRRGCGLRACVPVPACSLLVWWLRA
jgi:hypothetical protein